MSALTEILKASVPVVVALALARWARTKRGIFWAWFWRGEK